MRTRAEFERGADYFSARLRNELRHAIDTALPSAGFPNWPLDDPDLSARAYILEIEIDALEVLELDQLATLQSGGNPGVMASVARMRSVELQQQVMKFATDVVGYDVLYWTQQRPLYDVADLPTRHPEAIAALPKYLNNRAGSIAGGESEIQRDIIARALLGR